MAIRSIMRGVSRPKSRFVPKHPIWMSLAALPLILVLGAPGALQPIAGLYRASRGQQLRREETDSQYGESTREKEASDP